MIETNAVEHEEEEESAAQKLLSVSPPSEEYSVLPLLLSDEDLDLLLGVAGSSQVETRVKPPPGFREGFVHSATHSLLHCVIPKWASIVQSKACRVLKFPARGHPYMTSAKFWDFLTPSPPLSAFGTDLQY